MTTPDTRPDIPFGMTYHQSGTLLTYKSNYNGFWLERTVDQVGNVLTSKDSNGHWFERTADKAKREITHKDSDGYAYKRAYDQDGRELTYKDNKGVSWVAIAHDGDYTLGYDANTHLYHASCRTFTREQALEHWGSPREDNIVRASIFLAAINNNKE